MKIIQTITVIFMVSLNGLFYGQEGCFIKGVIVNQDKDGIDNVLICRFDSTEYDMEHTLSKLDEHRKAMLEKDGQAMHSMGLSSAKGELNFLLGSSKYAIAYHPDYKLKIIEREKLSSPCNFEFVILERK